MSRVGRGRGARGLRAELGARAERDAIDERTGRELVLRLHERLLRRELQGADLGARPSFRHGSRRCTQLLAELVS